MTCLKCGRDTTGDQVFCDACLDVMEYYPVKPGTAVQLPKRPVNPPRKPVKRRAPSLEDQIRTLKQRVIILTISLIVALLIAILLAIPAYDHLVNESIIPGQNYSVVTPTASSTATSSVTTN